MFDGMLQGRGRDCGERVGNSVPDKAAFYSDIRRQDKQRERERKRESEREIEGVRK